MPNPALTFRQKGFLRVAWHVSEQGKNPFGYYQVAERSNLKPHEADDVAGTLSRAPTEYITPIDPQEVRPNKGPEPRGVFTEKGAKAVRRLIDADENADPHADPLQEM